MILGALMHQDLWVNLKRNEKHSRAPHLAPVPVFFTCESSFLFMENNQTELDVMNIVQRRIFTLLLLSNLLFQRAPKGAWKAFANKDGWQLAEHAAAQGHPLRSLPGVALLSSHV